MSGRKLALVLAVLLAATAAPAAAAPPVGAGGPPERFIVVLHDGADPQAVANEHANNHAAQIAFVYTRALNGYAAVIPNERVPAIRGDQRVKYVEPDQVATTMAQAVPYGIKTVGADVSPTATAGNGSGSVSNVNAYVIDSGIDKSHPDLSVINHVNFTSGSNKDCNGHGTHVAGTVAARDNTRDVVGVSPGSPLTGVKVLGCDGQGYYSWIIKGVDWVTANAKNPAVANMSLGGEPSQALDDAVRNSAASGIFYAVAAGNSGKNACDYSPARAGAGTDNGIATIAATDSADKEASFSNFGSCVDMWAPGVSVVSTRKGGGTTTKSGTSMAAPHVAGGASVYLSTHPGSSTASVESALRQALQVPGSTSKDGELIHREHIGTF
ncbi:MAG: S8 family peptidase [Actinobacteria bacterium]|nr:S8 family peptidase [Actinomycetota bacterium]